jgi:ubiquinone/menaquinone biosynthesis C-methylase UbiE
MNINEFRDKVVAFRESRILHTALHHRFFDFVKKGSGAEEIADMAGSDVRAAKRVLDALVTMDVLMKSGNEYQHTEMSRKYLISDAEESRFEGLLHSAYGWKNWTALPDIVKSGELPERRTVFDDDHRYRNFILAMHDYQKPHADEVAEVLEINPNDKVLDCGGGPGTFARAFKRAQPDAGVTLFDLPEGIEIAKELTDEVDIQFIGGDFFADELGGPYDLIFLSNIIHSWSPNDNRTLLDILKKNLQKGGQLVIRDRFVQDDGTTSKETMIFSLHMLVNNCVGGCYPVSEVKEWLFDLNFTSAYYETIKDHTEIVIAAK